MASNNISILVKAVDQASPTLKKIADSSESETQRVSAAYTAMARVVKYAAVAGVAGATAGFAASVKSAGDFESSLSQLAYNANATGDELASLTSKARQLGRDNDLAGVTASAAADAMNELAKAGLSTTDILDASKSVMSLAKAGNIEYAEAATIAASALNAFGLSGKEASKVADALAAGANASQADLADLALGMQQSATVAKQFKLSINDNVTALALFANNGIKGSDAGTSLKTMLIALAKPSDSAAAAMKDIGFSAYDAKGQFVGLREMSIRLKNATKDLTDEQKQNALATIFGTDAFRAASVLSDNAGDSYDKMSRSVGKAGAAQRAAAASQGAFNKAIENFKNQLSDVALEVGGAVLPSLTSLISALTSGIAPAFRAVSSTAQTSFDIFNAGRPIFVGLAAGVVGYNAAMVVATATTKALALAQTLLNATMKLSPIGLLIAGTVGLVGAIASMTMATSSNNNVTGRMAQLRREAKDATDAAKLSEDLYRGALLNQEGAALRVEAAQKNYNVAVQQFGPSSLEARQANYDLKRATDDKAQADRSAKKAQEERDAAQTVSNAKAGAVVQAESTKRNAIQLTSDKIGGQAGKVENLSSWLDKLNGRKISYTIEEAQTVLKYSGVTSKESQAAARATLLNPNGKRAMGGPVAQGRSYLVGENGPELFTPATGGNISANAAPTTNITISGNIHIATPQAADAFWNRIDKTQRLARVGMA